LDPGTDRETDIYTGPCHDTWAFWISWYCPLFQ